VILTELEEMHVESKSEHKSSSGDKF
jgi:hypothetical protein